MPRVVGHPVEHGDTRARAALDRGGEADVVEMMMRREHELDVLDPQPLAPQAGLERRLGARLARARVDQRDRVAGQQPRVHGPDVRQRKRDGNDGRHEVTSVWHIVRSTCEGLAFLSAVCIIS